MNFGFLGIQFGFALQNANVSRIFETLGANIDEIAILWIAAPTTGLLIQPIIGYYSDRTWSNTFGRRKPYFLIGAILASIALFVMPHSSVLWFAAGMLWILDASINISMEPFRALIGDMMSEKQRTIGFAMQTFFIGVGAVVASMLPYIMTNLIGLESTAPKGKIPATVVWSFYIGGLVFFLSVLWSVIKTKEYSPEELAAYNGEQHEHTKGSVFQIFTDITRDIFTMPKTMAQLAFVQFFTWLALFAMWIYTTSAVTSHIYDMRMSYTNFEKLYVLINETSANIKDKKAAAEYDQIKESLSQLQLKYQGDYEPAMPLNTINLLLDNKILSENQLVNLFADVIEKEKVFNLRTQKIRKELAKAQNQLKENPSKQIDLSYETFSYFTAADRQQKLGLDAKTLEKVLIVSELKAMRKQYNDGADWVGVMFAIYNGFSAIFALLFPPFARATSRKTAHKVGLTVGGVGLISIYFMPNPDALLLSMVAVGFAWASILTMPYAILAGSLPANKMGIYMGIFNFFIVLPQIVASGILGFITEYFFDNQAVYTLVFGGICMIVAALLVFLVDDEEKKEIANS
ncbi:MAG: MFS transporter [Bacteroidia bacterium]|nr:MFS transporter [Bacteroidia bacterium]